MGCVTAIKTSKLVFINALVLRYFYCKITKTNISVQTCHCFSFAKHVLRPLLVAST